MNPFFDVVRQPLYAEHNGEQVDVGKDALINGETGECLGVVSKQYKVATNEEINLIVSEALHNVPVLSTMDHLNAQGNKWIREIVLDGDQFTHPIKDSDVVKTKVQIINGYGSNTAASIVISMYRMICTNGMFGWGDAFKSSYNHITTELVEKLRDDFDRESLEIKGQVDLWRRWAELPFTQAQFSLFIDQHTKKNDLALPQAFLSEKQGEGIKALYPAILNEYGDDETRWGAYNVITAIGSHHVQARSGSHLFSQGHARMNKLANAFYHWNPDTSTPALTA